MGIDGSISRSSGEVLVLAVRNVLVRSRISVFLGESEIDNVNHRLSLPESDEKVIRLYITVNEGLCVHILQTAEELIRQHQHRFELESSPTIVEQIL